MTFGVFCIEYDILPNLIDHLEDVAALASLISQSWIGERPFNKDQAIRAALLHDIGNMAKSKPETLEQYFKSTPDELAYWQDRLNDFQSKYGTDDHRVTDQLLDELNVSEEIRAAVQAKSFANIIQNAQSNQWLVKLTSYADLRINPSGIVTLQERLDYIKDRYPKYSSRADFEEMCSSAQDLESQIRSNSSLDLDSLTSQILKNTSRDLNFKELVL